MKQFLTLFPVLFKSLYRRAPAQKKTPVAAYIGIAVSMIILGAAIAVLIAFQGPAIKELNMVPEMTASLFIAIFFMVFFFGTSGIYSYVYYQKDSEFLISLPLKTHIIYIAKLAIVYVQEVSLALVFILPAGFSLGFSTGQGAQYFLIILLGAVTIPALSLLFSSIAAIPIMALSSFFKGKGLVGAILMLAFFALVMTAYLIIVLSIENASFNEEEFDIYELMSRAKEVAAAIATVFYPLYSLARIGTLSPGILAEPVPSVLLDAGIFVSTFAVMSILAVTLGNALFKRGVLSFSTRNPGSKQEVKKYESSNVVGALMKKEWRCLIRNSQMAFQCLAGHVIAPAFGIIYPIFFASTLAQESPENGYEVTVLVTLLLIGMMTMGINMFASSVISREGKSFAYSKTIPVSYEVQLKAKRNVSLILSAISISIGVIAMSVTTTISFQRFDFLIIPLHSVFLFIFAFAVTNMDMLHDLKKPNLFWTNPKEIFKNNLSMLIPLLIGFLINVVGFAIPFAAIMVFQQFGFQLIGTVISYVVCIGVAIVFSVVTNKKLMSKGPEYYEQLTV